MEKTLLVGGTFDAKGGKPSGLISKIGSQLGCPYINGGMLDMLYKLNFSDLKVLLWFPNIDNSEDKILPLIKDSYPTLLLVQSKRITGNNYSEGDVVGRLLKSRSNLGVIFREVENLYHFQLIDPLGNEYVFTNSVPDFVYALENRINYLLSLTRIRSKTIVADSSVSLPVSPEFVEIIREYGEEFTKYVNAVNPNRLLGNASTRCAKGFPAQRLENSYLVSRRNVDKTTLSENDFVQVAKDEDHVTYFGNVKPSVDTPIQIRLFNYYSNINYMIHGHVYVKHANFTKSKVPCGYIEEFEEIKEVFPDPLTQNFCINLSGHGCLILANDLSYFKGIELVGRPFPELS